MTAQQESDLFIYIIYMSGFIKTVLSPGQTARDSP